ncbi:hypothetical protein LA080_005411 [Diaporthe eres]|nr:hypothetical protein LA080_005411 [Diaporthe eres]
MTSKTPPPPGRQSHRSSLKIRAAAIPADSHHLQLPPPRRPRGLNYGDAGTEPWRGRGITSGGESTLPWAREIERQTNPVQIVVVCFSSDTRFGVFMAPVRLLRLPGRAHPPVCEGVVSTRPSSGARRALSDKHDHCETTPVGQRVTTGEALAVWRWRRAADWAQSADGGFALNTIMTSRDQELRAVLDHNADRMGVDEARQPPRSWIPENKGTAEQN